MLEYDCLCAGVRSTAYVLDYYDDLCDDGVRPPLSVLDYEQLFGGLL